MSYIVTIPGEDADLRELMCGYGKHLAKDDDSFIIHFPPRTMVFESYNDWLLWSNHKNNMLTYSEAMKKARQLTLDLAVIH